PDSANIAYLYPGVKPVFGKLAHPPPADGRRDQPLRRLFGLLHDIEQFHVKDERRAWLDARRHTALAIGELGRTDQTALTANVHVLHAFCPALDDPLQGKSRGLPPLYRTIENRAVNEGAVVVHLHRVSGRRRCARARGEGRDDES